MALGQLVYSASPFQRLLNLLLATYIVVPLRIRGAPLHKVI